MSCYVIRVGSNRCVNVTLEESVNHIVGMGLHWDAKRCWPAWCMHRICTAALTPCYDVIAAAAGRGYAVSKLVKI